MIEEFYLEPLSGEFDLPAVRAFLEGLPNTFEDDSVPRGEAPYLICGNPHAYFAARRHVAEGLEDYPPVALVRIKPAIITISHRCDEDCLSQSREFAEWILARYAVRVTDAYGNSWPANAAELYA